MDVAVDDDEEEEDEDAGPQDENPLPKGEPSQTES